MRGPSPSPETQPGWFDRIGPADAPTPLVCAVPHAGRHYPAGLLARAAVPLTALEELEDRHADLLIAGAVEAGAVAIVARAARAWIDLNRGAADLDPAQRQPGDEGTVTARARSGLGLLPSRLGRRELWATQPDATEAAARIAAVHAPYHAAIGAALEAARRRHGFAILVDCHSMPPLRGTRPARIVIGDRHGRSAAPGLAAELTQAARDEGHVAALNAPYAGAYSIEWHGRPGDNVHAVQVEVDRTLYLKSDLRTIGPGLERARTLVALLAARAVSVARGGPSAIAAE